MTETRILTNKYFGWFFTDAANVADITAITATEAAQFTNISDTLAISGTTFNTKASSSENDRSFADAAGATTAGDPDASGNISGYRAADGDTTSSFYEAEQGIKPAGKDIILLARPVASTSAALAAGDEYDAWHILTDAPTDTRGAASYTWVSVGLLQSDMGIRGIIAPATPEPVTVAVAAGSLTGAAGSVAKLSATYQGVNVTIGATWSTSDPTIATVTEHGIVQLVSTGTANITASFPGATTSTPQAVTVS